MVDLYTCKLYIRQSGLSEQCTCIFICYFPNITKYYNKFCEDIIFDVLLILLYDIYMYMYKQQDIVRLLEHTLQLIRFYDVTFSQLSAFN